MAISIQYKVVNGSGAPIYTGPSTGYKQVTPGLANGATVTVTEIKKDTMLPNTTWGNHSKGWSPITNQGRQVMQQVSTTSSPSTSTTSASTLAENQSYSDSEIASIVKTITNEVNLTTDVQFKMKSARSIMGLPHQFINTADKRVPNSNFGRMFTENILMDMPIVNIIPGGPRFLSGKGINKQSRANMINAIAKVASTPASAIGTLIDDLTGGENAKYYTFETQYSEYMMYVNNLARIMSIYLGIRKNALWGGSLPYANFSWENEKMEADGGINGVTQLLASHGAVTFYFDKSGSGVSESASNTTDKSMLDSAMNSASNLAKEAEFMFGVGAGTTMDFMNEALAEQTINTLSSNLAKDNNIFSRLFDNLKAGFTTVVSGANMLLPEIWRDASFSRSYTMNIHLASPYGTPEAWYLNVGVPLCFILPLVMPRQFGANAFYSPFLIQAFSSGMFSCSLGIVDSMSISRFGSGDSISRTGLPLEITVSLTFKDLYGALGVSTAANTSALMNNVALLDFLANLTAVNLNEPELARKLRTFVSQKADTLTDIPDQLKNKIFDATRDSINNSVMY